MRGFLLLLLLSLAGGCLAQSSAPTPSLFDTVHQDVIITAYRHSTGADMVEITSPNPDYPPELMKSQFAEIAKRLGTQAWSIEAVKYSLGPSPRDVRVRVTGVMKGLIDREKGVIHIGAIAQAFAGVPEPFTVKGIDASFNKETPTAKMVRSYDGPGGAVHMAAVYSAPSPASDPVIEYRIQLVSQNPEEVSIPDTTEPKAEKIPSTGRRTGVDWTLWGLLAVGALAAGALVYSLLLRSSPRPRS